MERNPWGKYNLKIKDGLLEDVKELPFIKRMLESVIACLRKKVIEEKNGRFSAVRQGYVANDVDGYRITKIK